VDLVDVMSHVLVAMPSATALLNAAIGVPHCWQVLRVP
jgi:hypothetical protein